MGSSYCIPLRSSIFFGASIHIFLGTIQFFQFVMQIFLFILHSKRPEQTSLTLISFFILLMGALFLPLGCCIFRGVEKEKLHLLKVPMWLFIITKSIQIILQIYQEGALFNPQRKVFWEDRLFQIIDIGAAVIYSILLFIYVRQLQQGREGSDYFKAVEVDDDIDVKKRSKF